MSTDRASTDFTTSGTRLTPAALRVLDAASDLFFEHGITSVGVDLVAERAQVTKKTIYDRFGSKDGLVVAYLEARFARWQRHVEDHLARSAGSGRSDGSGVRRVLDVLDALETWLDQGTRGCGFVNAYAELSTRSEAATAVVRAEKDWVRETYLRVLTEAGFGHRPALARRLAVVHEGAIVQRTAGDSPYALDDARTAARHLLEAEQTL